jgi:hypothetical protein
VSATRRRSTSLNTAHAVNCFVIDPIRYDVPGVAAIFLSRSARPHPPLTRVTPFRTTAIETADGRMGSFRQAGALSVAPAYADGCPMR